MEEENKDRTNAEPHMTGLFDDVLTHIGDFGRYQKRIFLFLCLPGMVCAMHKLAWVFLGPYSDHRCLLPFEQKNTNYHLPLLVLNMTIPRTQTGFSQCERLDSNFTEEYFLSGVPASTSVPCSAWVFDKQQYQSSAVFEFNLVCEWGWARAVANTLLVVGGLTGATIFGNLSDRFGRRPIFFSALVLQVSVGILASMAPNYWSFVVARFAIGAAVPGVYIVAYVLGMEMVGASKRQYASILLQVFFSLGYLLTALIAYFVTDWRNLQFAISVPGLFFLVYWWLIPESPRWLVSQGRVLEAADILESAAIENKHGVSRGTIDKVLASVLDKIQMDAISQKHTQTLLHVCKYPNLRRNAGTMLVVWFVNGLSYFGLSWNTGDLGGNNYVNFAISGMVEIPAHILVLLVVNWKGRVAMQSSGLLVAGVALLLTTLVPSDMPWLMTLLAMLGKMTVTASYNTAYILSGEIFPTCVRNAGMGACSTMAAIGAMVASFIILLSSYWQQLPFLILGALALLTGLLASMLPETLNRDLPETLEDGENFGRVAASRNKKPMIDVKI